MLLLPCVASLYEKRRRSILAQVPLGLKGIRDPEIRLTPRRACALPFGIRSRWPGTYHPEWAEVMLRNAAVNTRRMRPFHTHICR